MIFVRKELPKWLNKILTNTFYFKSEFRYCDIFQDINFMSKSKKKKWNLRTSGMNKFVV